jgi:hypothetical protein
MAAINNDVVIAGEPAKENVSLKWPHLACFVAKRNKQW